MTRDMRQAGRLGRQLRRDGASPVEISETVDEVFDRPEPKLRAYAKGFRARIHAVVGAL